MEHLWWPCSQAAIKNHTVGRPGNEPNDCSQFEVTSNVQLYTIDRKIFAVKNFFASRLGGEN